MSRRKYDPYVFFSLMYKYKRNETDMKNQLEVLCANVWNYTNQLVESTLKRMRIIIFMAKVVCQRFKNRKKKHQNRCNIQTQRSKNPIQ